MGFQQLRFPTDTLFLVTGGAGFIGSNLCEAILEMGYHVRCMDNLSTGKQSHVDMFSSNPNYEFLKGDIQNPTDCLAATKGVSYVLHQAAWGSVPRSIEQPVEYAHNNTLGTLNMLEASRQNHVKKFVYATSSAVYGDDSSPVKIESSIGELLSPYAVSKLENEHWAKMYTMHYGLDTYGMRYFNVFGKRQDPNGAYAAVIPKFIQHLMRNERPVIYGDGLQTRDFVYIDNVVEANLRACLAPHQVAGQVFNIAFGQRENLLEMYQYLMRIMKVNLEPIFEPERTGDIKHSNADISKAKELLGYSPDYNFEQGMDLAIAWYQENL